MKVPLIYENFAEKKIEYEMETIDVRISKIAEEIASWESAEQELLLQKLAELNYQQGLHTLSDKIQSRLKKENKLYQPVDEVFEEMARIRDKVAKDDYNL